MAGIPTRARSARTRLLVGLLAGILLLAGASPQALAQRPKRGPAHPHPAPAAPAQPAPAAAPAAPPATAAAPSATTAGLCQCIAEHNALRFSCLAGASACQAACGTTHYSFVPDASLDCSATGEAAMTPPSARAAISVGR